MQDEEPYKVIIVGEFGVGKTSLLQRLVHNKYSEEYKVTIGVEYLDRIVHTESGTAFLQLWDSAGQEKFRSLVRLFYRGVVAVILVYSVGDIYSLLALESWLKDVRANSDVEDKVFILVGNKADLHRETSYEDGLEFMKNHGIDVFFETSAKTGENVQAVLSLSYKGIQ